MADASFIPRAMTIAGSDSSGGAGIQADLRTFAALGVYGTSAVTALTAQSTTEVRAILPVPASFVAQQIDVVLEDLDLRVVKTGMLSTREIIEVVAERIEARGLVAVVDPVMVATSGARLLDRAAEHTLSERLLPLAALFTPNLHEIEALLGSWPADPEAMLAAAWALKARGARAVLVKGGHLTGEPVDVLLDENGRTTFLSGERISGPGAHGTGCTYAAAIAAGLAKGEALEAAVRAAHRYLRTAITQGAEAPALGRGPGPVHHMHPYYPWPKVSRSRR